MHSCECPVYHDVCLHLTALSIARTPYKCDRLVCKAKAFPVSMIPFITHPFISLHYPFRNSSSLLAQKKNPPFVILCEIFAHCPLSFSGLSCRFLTALSLAPLFARHRFTVFPFPLSPLFAFPDSRGLVSCIQTMSLCPSVRSFTVAADCPSFRLRSVTNQ